MVDAVIGGGREGEDGHDLPDPLDLHWLAPAGCLAPAEDFLDPLAATKPGRMAITGGDIVRERRRAPFAGL